MPNTKGPGSRKRGDESIAMGDELGNGQEVIPTGREYRRWIGRAKGLWGLWIRHNT
jgi:hypothetical protein